MKKQPVIVSVLGWSGAGKTTFIERALEACAERGLAAAAIKKSRHAADLPPDAKDSSRFRAAGAAPSVYIGESEMVLLLPAPPAAPDAAAIADLCPGAVLVFCEGLEVSGAIIALVGGSAASEAELKRPLSLARALISDDSALRGAAEAKGLPVFSTAETDRFLNFVMAEKEERDV